MKTRKSAPVAAFAVAMFLFCGNGFCQLSDVLEGAKKALISEEGTSSGQEAASGQEASTGGDSDSQVAMGIKEALEIGAKNAVSTVSKVDGYYGDPDIKILLPEKIRNFESLLRGAGLGSQVDAFEESMNRAAEKAAPEAQELFVDTVKDMSFSDAQEILQGPDDAATQYFREKTGPELAKRFEPIVEGAMSEVGVTRYYQDIHAQLKDVPLADLSGFDLNQYVTDKALDGLFLMVAEEEKKIRENPAARVTDLLQSVFSKSE